LYVKRKYYLILFEYSLIKSLILFSQKQFNDAFWQLHATHHFASNETKN